MSIYELIEEPLFPPLSHAEPDGLLALGGDLSVERLLLAYSSGIFPWFNEDDPILWWSPDPRFVLNPDDLNVSRSLEKIIRQGRFEVRVDSAFERVIRACGDTRRGDGECGTWITDAMIKAYCRLHELGFAHSVESWYEGDLAGGLYGVSLGRCFFGESMFARTSNASKVAFVTMVRGLKMLDFELIDCQMPSGHLESLGASGIPRDMFIQRLVRGGVTPSVYQQQGSFIEKARQA
ncbi:MAG: leucyl/phenylalanyl-tRNA--protein transferase [bacterium]|nr:leucyl/phenylalanyl-tRNA--protein transferase [bacterium]